jgi:hypothetical protein
MITLAMLYWIGYQLYAPDWYWWCWGIAAFLNVIQFGINCYKKGRTL